MIPQPPPACRRTSRCYIRQATPRTQVQNGRGIAEDFELAAAAMLPIASSAVDVALMDNSSGGWQIRDLCALGGMRS